MTAKPTPQEIADLVARNERLHAKCGELALALASKGEECRTQQEEIGRQRHVCELAGDARWHELAAGSPFTLIDRRMLAEMFSAASAIAPPKQE